MSPRPFRKECKPALPQNPISFPSHRKPVVHVGCVLWFLMQGLGLDADFGGVVKVRNSPFVGAEAFYRMSEETTGFSPVEVAVPRNSDGRFSGDAYLTYATEEQAIACERTISGHVFQGRKLEAQVVRRMSIACEHIYQPSTDTIPHRCTDYESCDVCGDGWLMDGTFRLGT